MDLSRLLGWPRYGKALETSQEPRSEGQGLVGWLRVFIFISIVKAVGVSLLWLQELVSVTCLIHLPALHSGHMGILIFPYTLQALTLPPQGLCSGYASACNPLPPEILLAYSLTFLESSLTSHLLKEGSPNHP